MVILHIVVSKELTIIFLKLFNTIKAASGSNAILNQAAKKCDIPTKLSEVPIKEIFEKQSTI